MIIAMTNQELIELLEEKFGNSINNLIITEETGKSVTINKKEINLDKTGQKPKPSATYFKIKPLERF